MTSCLVTGGAGAIGSHLVVALLRDGHQVTVIDDLSSGHRNLVPEKARLVVGSIEDDAVLSKGFESRPEWVFHLAALFANQNSVDHPQRDLLVNGLGMVKVLERCVNSGTRKLLYTSSSCVYGGRATMKEDEPPEELDTPYAVSKLLGEHYCQLWSRLHSLDTVIVRLFNTYGPHEYPGRYRNVIPNFIAMAMRGEPLPITGTGEETRDFNFVTDTVAGLVDAMAAETAPGDVYNLASGSATKIIDLANTINTLAKNSAGVLLKPRRNWDQVLHRRGDPTKARAKFGFAPKVTIADGVAQTLSWLKSMNV